jgi:tetratricopeptide (TPR) repeat protein
MRSLTAEATRRSRRSILWQTAAIIALLATGWLVYRPALSGTFLLDDHANLSGLQSVDGSRSALHFVLSGDAGPLGRPLALASFLPQASAWGSDATPFLRVNILIHLLNGLLLFLFSRLLGRSVLRDSSDIVLLSFATTALWLFMPLLATSSLLIVQRMTTLSATFVLCGLNAYLIVRGRLESRPNAALLTMSLALVVATLLATFTKENGALLPVFVFVLEATILKPPQNITKLRWNGWRSVFLGLPTLSVVVFLLVQLPYSADLIAARDFTASERLLSEALILWEYLANAFFPWGANLGPFHESRLTSNLFSEPLSALALVAWFVAALMAIRNRRRFPVAAFATLWFLAGHLSESTTIPLELYFEHRNYLPIIGPVFALCYLAIRFAGRYRPHSRVALASYISLNAITLLGITSMWGNPLLAAAYWHERDPASVRAATTLAAQQLSTSGPDDAVRTLREFAAHNPQHAYIRIPELNLACALDPGGDHSELLEYLESGLPLAEYSMTVGEMLDQLLSRAASGNCASVDPATVLSLAAALMENPRYRGSIRYNQFHYTLLARIAKVSGDNDTTLDHLAHAIEIAPSDKLNMMMITTLVAAGRFEEARQFIDDATDDLPLMPLQRYNSKKNLEELQTYVNETERLTEVRDSQSNGE